MSDVHLQRGATIVAYSGGKAICGPQCAGCCWTEGILHQHAGQRPAPRSPAATTSGPRGNAGLPRRRRCLVSGSRRRMEYWLSWLDTIAKRVATIDGIKTKFRDRPTF